MTSRIVRPLPISEECNLETILPYAAVYIDGRVVASRSAVAFEVYAKKRRRTSQRPRFVLAARRPYCDRLLDLLSPALRRKLAIARSAGESGALDDVFKKMVADGTTVSFLPLPHSGGAVLLVRESADEATVEKIRLFNRSSNRAGRRLSFAASRYRSRRTHRAV